MVNSRYREQYEDAVSCFLRAQETPDLLDMNVAQLGRYQRACPARKSGRRGTFQDGQNASAGLGAVLRHGTRMRPIGQTSQPFPRETTTPGAHYARHHTNRLGDRPCRAAFGRQQYDARAQNIALFRRRCSYPSFKQRTVLRPQPHFRCFGNHPNVES
jgi:hypothetical protein